MTHADLVSGNAYIRRSLYLANGAVVVCLALSLLTGLIALFQPEITPWAVAAISLANMAFCIKVGYPRALISSHTSLPDFLAIYFVFAAINKIFVITNATISFDMVDSLDYLLLYGTPYNKFLAEMIFFCGHIFFYIGWTFIEGRRPQPHLTEISPKNLLLLSLMLLGLWKLSERVTTFAQFSGFLNNAYLTVVYLLLVGRSRWGIGGRNEILTMTLMLPGILSAASSGIKASIIAAAGPAILANLVRPRGRGFVLLFLGAMALAGIVQPLSGVVREANWIRREQISTFEAFERLYEQYQQRGSEVFYEGLKSFSSRASASNDGATVVGVRDERGPIGLETIRNVPAAFIPRVLWPDKPIIAPGAWFTFYIGRAASPETATSATATPLSTEFYWMSGWWSVALGMALMGAYFSWIWGFMIRLASWNLPMLFAAFSTMGTAMTFDTLHAIYAITGPPSVLGLVAPIAIAYHILRKRRARAAQRRWMEDAQPLR